MIWNYASHPSDLPHRLCFMYTFIRLHLFSFITCILCILLCHMHLFFIFNELDYVCNGAVSL